MYGLGSKKARLSRHVRCSLRDEPTSGHVEHDAILTVGKKIGNRKNRDCIIGVECIIHRMYHCRNGLKKKLNKTSSNRRLKSAFEYCCKQQKLADVVEVRPRVY